MDLLQQLLEQALRNRGRVVGTLLGLLFGLMVISYGVFKTLFVALCLGLGYYLGRRSDEGGRGLS